MQSSMQDLKKQTECESSAISLKSEPKPFVRTASCTRHPPFLDDPETVSSVVGSWAGDPFDGLLDALMMVPKREMNGSPSGVGFETHMDNQLNEP